MATARPKPLLKGDVFVAQACSCTCDPCTCGDTCTCEGADAYIGPRWRLVGDHIQDGNIQGIDVSQRTLLHLGQSSSEHANDWQEVILIDDRATPEQVRVLLETFQNQGSELAHPHQHPSQRAVYLAPMRYGLIEGHPTLDVTIFPGRFRVVHDGSSQPQAWTYNGHVALQGHLEE